MSHNTPNPVALTSAMLMAASIHTVNNECGTGDYETTEHAEPFAVADLASAIHRLAPACRKLAEAECNGEWRDGQRDALNDAPNTYGNPCGPLEAAIERYATRLDRRIAKLNAELAPFGYQLIRSGDPRGATLRMAETPVNDSTTHYSIG